MNIKKLSITVFLILFILFGAVSAVLYDKSDSVDIICYANSYAEEYAKEHNIDYGKISDSDAYIGILNLENFDYNVDGSIVSYNGESETIAIPTDIEGTRISKVKENAFANAKNLKKIYIPNSIQVFEPKTLENITVYLYEYSELYKSLSKDKENKLEIKTIPDSYYVDFYKADIPFSYDNISDKSIEINRYHAFNDLVLIPESIDGKIVTAISFDALTEGVKTIVIPKSVTVIKTDLYKNRYDFEFLIGMIFAFAGTVIATIFLLTAKTKTKERTFLSISQFITVYTLFVLSLIISGLYLFVPEISKWIIYVALAVVCGFAIISILKAKTAAAMVEGVEKRVNAQTQFIKSLTVDAQNLINRANTPKLKEYCKKVYEILRYSDPVSNPALEDVEKQIKEEFVMLTDSVIEENEQTADSASKEIISLLNRRNAICKSTK